MHAILCRFFFSFKSLATRISRYFGCLALPKVSTARCGTSETSLGWPLMDWRTQMLVLTRKTGERILVGDNVVIHIVRTAGNVVKLGIEAPDHIRILRAELPQLPQQSSLTSPPPSTPAH